MAAPSLSGLITIVDAMSSTKDPTTNVITINGGSVFGGEATKINLEQWGPLGLTARPANPESSGTGSAQLLLFNTGSNSHVLGGRDVRSMDMYGELSPGDTALYATGGPSRVLCKGSSGATSMYTEDADKNGQYIRVDPKGMKVNLNMVGSQVHDAMGFRVLTGSGASFSLGGLGVPGPLSAAIPSRARLSAGIISLDGSFLILGPSKALPGLGGGLVFSRTPGISGVPVPDPFIGAANLATGLAAAIPAMALAVTAAVTAAGGSPMTGPSTGVFITSVLTATLTALIPAISNFNVSTTTCVSA